MPSSGVFAVQGVRDKRPVKWEPEPENASRRTPTRPLWRTSYGWGTSIGRRMAVMRSPESANGSDVTTS